MNEPVQPVRARDAAAAKDITDSGVPQDDPIACLVKAMRDFGIDTSKLTVTREDIANSNPGGNWVDHELKVTAQDGRYVHLAVDLLQKNYAVGACDVQRMLNWTAPA
jgi:hypothetical protein